MKVEVLKKVSEKEFFEMGHNGYVSNNIFKLTTTEQVNSFSFEFSEVALEKPISKNYHTTADEIEMFNKLLTSDDSYGIRDRNGSLLGIVICEKQQWNNSMSLINILVSEKHRGKGIGKALIQSVIQNSKYRKVRIIEVETQNTNVHAIKFYRKLGFKITGLKEKLYDSESDEIALFLTYEIP